MTSRVEQLRRRRQLLISEAAAQRSEVSFIATNLQQHLRFVDMGFAIVQAIRIHPVLAVSSATLLLPTPRNKLIRWSSRLFTIWEVYSAVRKQWTGIR